MCTVNLKSNILTVNELDKKDTLSLYWLITSCISLYQYFIFTMIISSFLSYFIFYIHIIFLVIIHHMRTPRDIAPPTNSRPMPPALRIWTWMHVIWRSAVLLLTDHGDLPGGRQPVPDCLRHSVTRLWEPVLGPEEGKDQLFWELPAMKKRSFI